MLQTIQNTSTTLFHLPGKYGPGGAQESGSKHRNPPQIRIMPDQAVEYDLEALLEARPGLAKQYEALVPVRGPVRAPVVPQESTSGRTDPYASLNVREAKELIASEADLDELRTWRGLETRKTVVTALDERIAVLRAG